MRTFVLSCLIAAGLVLSLPPAADAQTRKRSKPLAVDVYKKPYRGGYSYRAADVIDTRRFVDPSLGGKAQGGPFDSGFFFETPRGPFGGTSPYFH
jgi:hypothetical protein